MTLNNVFSQPSSHYDAPYCKSQHTKFIDGDCAREKKYGHYMYLQNKFATANEVFGWTRNVFFSVLFCWQAISFVCATQFCINIFTAFSFVIVTQFVAIYCKAMLQDIHTHRCCTLNMLRYVELCSQGSETWKYEHRQESANMYRWSISTNMFSYISYKLYLIQIWSILLLSI